MVELTTLLSAVQSQPDAFQGITLGNLMCFVIYAGKLKDDILLVQSATHLPSVPPPSLPQSVAIFLAKACGMPKNEQIDTCWELLKDMIWNEESVVSAQREGTAFAEHGQGLGISTTIPQLPLYFSLINASVQPLIRCIHLNTTA